MDMNIYKSYNHDILSINEEIIDFSNFNEQNLNDFYKNHLIDNLSLCQKKQKYDIKKYSRKPEGNILYETYLAQQNKNKNQIDEYKFAIEYENNIIQKSTSNDIKKCYPNDWQDCLIYYDLHFISYIFIQFLEHECDQLIKLSNGKHKINIIYSSKITTEQNVDNVIYHILNILEWLIDKYKKDHNLTLNILLAPMEKSFNNVLSNTLYDLYDWAKWTQNLPNQGIRSININTGVSWNNNNNNNITLFRSDELFKVLIHELIHNLDLDFKCNICEHIAQKDIHFYVGDKESYPLLYNEGYVEYNALLLWNFYLVKYYNESNNNKTIDGRLLFHHMITREIINSAINCKKIFDYYEIKDLNIFSDYNNIKQYTNAFSYIFIKYLLLINSYSFDIDTGKNEINKSMNLNSKLKQIMDNIKDYNYLFDIQNGINNNCKKLKLSIYNFKER